MKVADIKRIIVDVPFTPRQRENSRSNWSVLELCKVTTDSGHVGWGETVIHYTYGRVTDETVERALGRNPAELMNQDDLGAGLQMALFDVVGKILEVPAHRLMGTKMRDWTPISWWSSLSLPEHWSGEAEEAVALGYTNLKTKPRPWQDVIGQVEAVSRVVSPDFHLDLDPNGSWQNAANAIPLMKRLEQYDIVAIFETPIPQDDILGNRQIRQAVHRPIAMHFHTPPYTTVIREEVCDGFVIGGGKSMVMRHGQLAAEAAMPFWLQLVGNGLTTTWGAHLGAVLTHATWPAISCINLYTHHLLTEPIAVVNGHQQVPDGPGLGVEVDEAAVENYRVPSDRLDEFARKGKLYAPPAPPRIISTVIYPDNTCIHMASLNVPGRYVEGIRTETWAEDGSQAWTDLYERVQQQPVRGRWQGHG